MSDRKADTIEVLGFWFFVLLVAVGGLAVSGDWNLLPGVMGITGLVAALTLWGRLSGG